MLSRRGLLGAGGLALAGLALPAGLRADGDVVEIRMQSDALGTRVWFDPIGVLIGPGQTVRWINDGANVHTSTAYHPANGNRPLRIPGAATPWDSGYLVEPESRFEIRLTEPGVYDYFCAPHEAAGMVGRIIVGQPLGPGAEPFDAFLNDPDRQHWQPVPPAAQQAFPSIEQNGRGCGPDRLTRGLGSPQARTRQRWWRVARRSTARRWSSFKVA